MFFLAIYLKNPKNIVNLLYGGLDECFEKKSVQDKQINLTDNIFINKKKIKTIKIDIIKHKNK